MSIAIVAAILACVSMLGHRAHNETLRLQGEAIQMHSEAANKWAYYQAQNVRKHLYQANLESIQEMGRLQGKEKYSSKTTDGWSKNVKKYESRLAKEKKIADDLTEKVKEKLNESAHVHHRANRFDYGELGIELAVVLCSLAVLTKNKGFWILGLLSCAVGTFVALSGLFDWFMDAAH
jgi:hypothetical protein